MKSLSSELNDTFSKEFGGLIGNVNVQIQRAVEKAICSQGLPQLQNVLRDLQKRDVSGPRDRERPKKGKSLKIILLVVCSSLFQQFLGFGGQCPVFIPQT